MQKHSKKVAVGLVTLCVLLGAATLLSLIFPRSEEEISIISDERMQVSGELFTQPDSDAPSVRERRDADGRVYATTQTFLFPTHSVQMITNVYHLSNRVSGAITFDNEPIYQRSQHRQYTEEVSFMHNSVSVAYLSVTDENSGETRKLLLVARFPTYDILAIGEISPEGSIVPASEESVEVFNRWRASSK